MQHQLRLPNKQGSRPGRRSRVNARAASYRPVSVHCTASAQPDQPECSTSGSQQQRSELPRQFWSLSSAQRVKLLSGLSAAAVFVPSVGGFNGVPPGGNGDGGGGGGDGGGSGGWFSSVQQLFDLAKDESDDESSAAKDGKGRNPWAKLITDSEELEGGSPTERLGTNRCTEIVIEGWPTIGNLPSQVRWELCRSDLAARTGVTPRLQHDSLTRHHMHHSLMQMSYPCDALQQQQHSQVVDSCFALCCLDACVPSLGWHAQSAATQQHRNQVVCTSIVPQDAF